jgi:hypothetical protein
MKFPRRQFLYLAAGAGALLVASRVVRAEGRLGQQVIVDNRPGAASNIAAEVVALRQRLSNQAPDNVGRGPARKADDEAKSLSGGLAASNLCSLKNMQMTAA